MSSLRTPAPPAGLDSPHALQILMTEHWSLLASRSLGYTESMSRASIFIAALSGSVIALALVGQATDFGDGFVAFALVLLPVVFFLGALDIRPARAEQLRRRGLGPGDEPDPQRLPRAGARARAVLRHEPSRRPDGVLLSSLAMRRPLPVLQPFFSIPGVVAVVDSVVAGAIVGIAALGLDLGTGWSVALGGLAFAVSLAAFVLWARSTRSRDTRRASWCASPNRGPTSPRLTADYPPAMASRAVPAPLAQIPNALTVLRLALIPLFVVV